MSLRQRHNGHELLGGWQGLLFTEEDLSEHADAEQSDASVYFFAHFWADDQEAA
jgi:hypothetical protein